LKELATLCWLYLSRLQKFEYVDKAITAYEDVVKITKTHPHQRLAFTLGSISNAFLARFGVTGSMTDLEEAEKVSNAALDVPLEGNLDGAVALYNCSMALFTRAKFTGSVDSLEAAIASIKIAITLCPEGSSVHPHALNMLSSVLQERFVLFGSLDDLNVAINASKTGLNLQISPENSGTITKLTPNGNHNYSIFSTTMKCKNLRR
jgi:hypothetical protein